MITLLPMMLMASWFARGNHSSRSSHVASGLTTAEAHRLDRILHSANDSPAAHNVSESLRDSDLNSRASHRVARLRSVSDNTFGIPQAERDAYEALLTQASNANQTDLERAAHKDVSFALLMLEPDRFRGELITIEGDLRRLHRIATSNHDGDPETYEAWIFTTDSGLNPYRVVCTSLPPGFAFGDQTDPPIRVRTTGYFFKRFSYATTGNYHTAPLLLAKTLTRTTSPKPIQRPNHRARTLTIIAVCMLLVLTIGWMLVGFSGRQPKRNVDDSSIR